MARCAAAAPEALRAASFSALAAATRARRASSSARSSLIAMAWRLPGRPRGSPASYNGCTSSTALAGPARSRSTARPSADRLDRARALVESRAVPLGAAGGAPAPVRPVRTRCSTFGSRVTSRRRPGGLVIAGRPIRLRPRLRSTTSVYQVGVLLAPPQCSNQSFGRGASSYLCAVPRPTDQPLTTLSASKHDRPTDQRAVVGDFAWQLSKNPRRCNATDEPHSQPHCRNNEPLQ